MNLPERHLSRSRTLRRSGMPDVDGQIVTPVKKRLASTAQKIATDAMPDKKPETVNAMGGRRRATSEETLESGAALGCRGGCLEEEIYRTPTSSTRYTCS